MDEQLIMERTEHRSLEGMHSYKHTSGSQKEAVSDLLNAKPAEQTTLALNQALATTTHTKQIVNESLIQFNTATDNYSKLNVQQRIHTAQSHLLPPTFNFHSCTACEH